MAARHAGQRGAAGPRQAGIRKSGGALLHKWATRRSEGKGWTIHAVGEDLPAFLNGKGRGPQRDGRPQSHGSVKGSAQNVGAKREERTFSKRAIGIDLGTTNSAVAIVDENGRAALIKPPGDAEDSGIIPSVVSFVNDEPVVGLPSGGKAVAPPESIFYSVKRLIGRTFDAEEAQAVAKRLPFEVVGTEGTLESEIRLKTAKGLLSPEEISCEILRALKERAEEYVRAPIEKVVLTVPAHFNSRQRSSTEKGAELAGLKVLRVINEPTAAAIAYGYGAPGEDRKVLVFDLGGGTLDVSILEIGSGVFEVLGSIGDSNLGGDDFDAVIVDWASEIVREQFGYDPRREPRALQQLNHHAEAAKIQLSSKSEVVLRIPDLAGPGEQRVELEMNITRADFEERCSSLIHRCKRKLMNAYRIATDEVLRNISKDQIDDVILVGGSTLLPCIQSLILDVTKKSGRTDVNPMEVVAIGAAIQAAAIVGDIDRCGVVNLDESPDVEDLVSYSESMQSIIGLLEKDFGHLDLEL